MVESQLEAVVDYLNFMQEPQNVEFSVLEEGESVKAVNTTVSENHPDREFELTVEELRDDFAPDLFGALRGHAA